MEIKKIGYIFGIILSLLWIYMGLTNFFISSIADIILVVTGCLALFINIYLFSNKKVDKS